MLRGPEEQAHISGLISNNFRWVCSEAVSKEIEERVAQNVAGFLQFNGCLCSTVAHMKAACIQIQVAAATQAKRHCHCATAGRKGVQSWSGIL